MQGTTGYNNPEVRTTLRVIGQELIQIKSNSNSSGVIDINSTVHHPDLYDYRLVSSLSLSLNNNTITNFDFNYLKTTNKRVFLKEVIVDNSSKKYNFEYEDPEGLIERLSAAQDSWGYFNGKTNNNNYFPDLESIGLEFSTSFPEGGIGADKSIDTLFAKKGILKKIIYPTKGYTSFLYEGNSFFGETSTDSPKKSVLLNLNTETGSPFNEYEVSKEIINVPFNQLASLTYSSDFNSNRCSSDYDAGKSQACVRVVDKNTGEDVPLKVKDRFGVVLAQSNCASQISAGTFYKSVC